jgi:hypothetical protein
LISLLPDHEFLLWVGVRRYSSALLVLGRVGRGRFPETREFSQLQATDPVARLLDNQPSRINAA